MKKLFQRIIGTGTSVDEDLYEEDDRELEDGDGREYDWDSEGDDGIEEGRGNEDWTEDAERDYEAAEDWPEEERAVPEAAGDDLTAEAAEDPEMFGGDAVYAFDEDRACAYEGLEEELPEEYTSSEESDSIYGDLTGESGARETREGLVGEYEWMEGEQDGFGTSEYPRQERPEGDYTFAEDLDAGYEEMEAWSEEDYEESEYYEESPEESEEDFHESADDLSGDVSRQYAGREAGRASGKAPPFRPGPVGCRFRI